jgi:hypothetical protein
VKMAFDQLVFPACTKVQLIFLGIERSDEAENGNTFAAWPAGLRGLEYSARLVDKVRLGFWHAHRALSQLQFAVVIT